MWYTTVLNCICCFDTDQYINVPNAVGYIAVWNSLLHNCIEYSLFSNTPNTYWCIAASNAAPHSDSLNISIQWHIKCSSKQPCIKDSSIQLNTLLYCAAGRGSLRCSTFYPGDNTFMSCCAYLEITVWMALMSFCQLLFTLSYFRCSLYLYFDRSVRFKWDKKWSPIVGHLHIYF